jgi:hypothetical protein
MAWMYLLAAGLLEIVWAYTMKLSEGFSRPLPTALTIVVMLALRAAVPLHENPSAGHGLYGMDRHRCYRRLRCRCRGPG